MKDKCCSLQFLIEEMFNSLLEIIEVALAGAEPRPGWIQEPAFSDYMALSFKKHTL